MGICLDVDAAVFEVDLQFLSIAVGIGKLEGNWSDINLTAPRIQNMAQALNPAMLRLGGTRGDFLLFNQSSLVHSSK